MSESFGRLQAYSWPRSRLGRALVALGRRCGLQPNEWEGGADDAEPPKASAEALDSWLRTAASRHGLEIEPMSTTYGRLDHLLRQGGPAILRLRDEGDERYALLVGGGSDTVTVLGPDGEERRLPLEMVRAALAARLEERVAPDVDQMMESAGIPTGRRRKARRALYAQRLDAHPVAAGWLLRLTPGAGLWQQMRHAGLTRHLFTFLGAYTVQHVLFLLSWWVIGRAALQKRLEMGWFWAWLLILLTIVPLRLLVTRAQGLLALHAGARLKRRLLAGVLRLEPDEVRHLGVGQLLGRVVESEAIESLALRGGFLGMVATVELIAAAAVLAMGAGGAPHVLLLLAWASLAGLLAWRHYRQSTRWTEARLAMTHDLVEQMVGHRTRLVQETPEQRHRAEDEALSRYLQRSQDMDRSAVLLSALLPRGWLLLGLVGLVPAFVTGALPVAALAIGLGGVLLALRALTRLARSLADVAGAAIAWRQISRLYRAAAQPVAAGDPDALLRLARSDSHPLVEARSLAFSYPGQQSPALRQCDFRLGEQAGVLLQGPSGGGKSTLAALLGGLRRPTVGMLQLRGLDRQTLGAEAWRRQVVVAPQFDDNHVLTSTFSFNLLMGRRWPAAPEDLREAETLCQELGLGPLLAAMPAGLQQMVGESGWQLSHGERARLYLARALLQNASLVVLDESFAALDPDNLYKALEVARQRAPALVVIAHP